MVLSSSPELAEPVDEASDLIVGVVEECRKRLLQSRREALMVLGKVVPRFDARVARRKLGPVGDDAEFELPVVPALSR